MEFSKLIEYRRSVRSYREAEITAEELTRLIDAARMAPTWKNTETGRYYIAASPDKVASVRALLPGFNQNSTAKAGAYIITTYQKGISGFSKGTADNEIGDGWGAYDLGLQNAYLLLQAADLGLDTLIMGLRDTDGLRSLFSIPEDEQLMAVIAVGKRAEEPLLRPRKPLEEIMKIY